VRDDTLDRNRRPISPDGKRIVVHRSDGFALYSVEGGGHRPVPGLDQSHIPIGWTPTANRYWLLSG